MDSVTLVETFTETLTEVSVDEYDFKVTWSRVESDTCLLWFRDRNISDWFEALGKFSRFDKRLIIEFIARYCTDSDFREQIQKRRFARKVAHLTASTFEQVQGMSLEGKRAFYRALFDLSAIIHPGELEWKRRIMALRFHPDRGGDCETMALINEAYELLSDAQRQ